MEKLLERDPAKDIMEFCRRENEKASQRAQDATYADDCVSKILSISCLKETLSSMGIVTHHNIPINI